MALRNASVITDTVIAGARPFIEKQAMAAVAARAADGTMWASLWFGTPGFLKSPEGRHIEVHTPEPLRDPSDPVWALIEFLEWAGKSPFVAFRAEFDQTMLERGMKDLFGVPVGFAWIDLAFLLPALFRGTECDSLDDWTGHFGIAAGARHDAVADAFATAQLFLIALQAADAVGMGSAGQLLEMQKAQRWLGTRR